jgi:hypothetical protein
MTDEPVYYVGSTTGEWVNPTKTLLLEIDELLTDLEDSAHGDEGERITQIRQKIQRALIQ